MSHKKRGINAAKLNALKQDENYVDEYAKDRPREIHIYYKLLEKPLPHKKFLEVRKDDESKETA